MKYKACPKCGSKQLGERWVKERMLQQYCYIGEDDTHCGWVGEPFVPPRKRITNTTKLRIDDFPGWHYLVYDKYGHIQTDSATYDTQLEAMKELQDDITPRDGYKDPAAPYTAVLFKVPGNVTIEGRMFRLLNGKFVEVSLQKPDHTITCVYCGQAYPEHTPTHGADVKVLTNHIKVCSKHPMKKLYDALVEIYDGGKLYGTGEGYGKALKTQMIAKHALGL